MPLPANVSKFPGSMAGSPAGPGASPVLSPGGGAGNAAAASGILKSIIPALHNALTAFPVNSPQYKAVDKALSALTPAFGAPQDGNLVPSSIMQLAQAAKSGQSPLAGAAPPLKAAPPPSPGGGGPSPMPSPAPPEAA